MKRILQYSVVTIIVVGALLAYPGTHGQDKEPQVNPRIHELMAQRRDTLRILVELCEERWRGSNSTNYNQFLALNLALKTAHHELLEAELALAENKNARIQLLENAVKFERAFEEELTERDESDDVILRATVDRMNAEIQLLKASQSQA